MGIWHYLCLRTHLFIGIIAKRACVPRQVGARVYKAKSNNTKNLHNMKLHLPKKFQTALMAAIATVSFSTVSTATLAAAAFTFAGYQAAAEETADAPELTPEEKEAEEKLNEKMEDNIREQQEEEEEAESKFTTDAIDWDVMKRRGSQFARGGDGASHQLAQQAYAAMEAEVFTPEASAAPQQQTTVTSGELPSDDLGFTTNPYDTSSTGNSGPVFEVTPAAPAADFLQDSPAENQGSGSTTGATSPAPVSASGFGGGASAGYSPSGYAAPAVRPLSVSVAPTALAAPASVAAPAAVAAPSPKLAAADTPLGELEYIFSFNNGETVEYFREVKPFYNLTVADGNQGVIEFNEGLRGKELEVSGDFIMNGADFKINTNGAKVTFDQPLSNYNTAFTITGGGEIVAKSDAAFGSLNVADGKLTIQSQIGVVSGTTIGAEGTLTVEDGAKLLLTKQIHNEGGLFVINGTIDASNLSPAEAQKIGISFVGLDKKTQDTSGFLAPSQTPWQIFDPKSEGTAQTGANAQLVVAATSTFSIQLNDNNQPVVSNPSVDTRMWFQNGGELESTSAVTSAVGQGSSLVSFLLAQVGDEAVKAIVDYQTSNDNVVYVSRGSKADITLAFFMDEERWGLGSIGNLYLLDNSQTSITAFSGQSDQVNKITFAGSNISLTNNESVPLTTERQEISPLSLTVESATTASVAADIMPYYGYYQGDAYQGGEYILKGQLTIENGYTFDLRNPDKTPSWEPVAQYNEATGKTTLIFEETVARLTMEDEGKLFLKPEASFKASTVTDNSRLTADGENLDTTRTMEVEGEVTDPKQYDGKWTKEMDNKNFQVNGTMEITGAVLSALNDNVSADAVNNYTTRNKNFLIFGGTMKVTDEGDRTAGGSPNTTVSNQLDGSNVINAKASGGRLTLDNDNDTFVSLGLVHAEKGDIYVTNKEAVTAHTVQIGASRKVASVNAETFSEQAENATLTVNYLLKAEGGPTQNNVIDTASKVKADVVLNQGATIDVSAAGGKGGLNLTGTLTINEGAMLSMGDIANLMALEIGESYDLAFGVVDVNFGDDVVTVDDKLEASKYFENLYPGEFYLCYTGVNGSDGSAGKNVGTVYLYKVMPEPTTGTLSLLALAGLAARRRRKG